MPATKGHVQSERPDHHDWLSMRNVGKCGFSPATTPNVDQLQPLQHALDALDAHIEIFRASRSEHAGQQAFSCAHSLSAWLAGQFIRRFWGLGRGAGLVGYDVSGRGEGLPGSSVSIARLDQALTLALGDWLDDLLRDASELGRIFVMHGVYSNSKMEWVVVVGD